LRSSGSPDDLTLDRDLPTSTGDVLALRHARVVRSVSLDEYLAFFRQFEPLPQSKIFDLAEGPAARS